MLSWSLLVALAVAAWWFVLPVGAGGRTTYVVVNGHSMEPLLHTGDVAIAREASDYHRGDLVVVSILGGNVIHRIVAGSERAGWRTKGDNNSWRDPWIVHRDNIAGRYVMRLGGAGSVLTWITDNPIGFAALSALAALTLLIPSPRRRIDPDLAAAVASATREPKPARNYGETGVLVLATSVAVISLLAAVIAATQDKLTTATGITALSAGAIVGLAALVLYLRVFDGRGISEPTRSQLVLSGRLYRVDHFPAVDATVHETRSALELRKIAEREHLPVLHCIDPTTGHERYITITGQSKMYIWDAHPSRRAEDAQPGGRGRIESMR